MERMAQMVLTARTVPMERMAPMVLMVPMARTEATVLGVTGVVGGTTTATAAITTKAGGEVSTYRKRDPKELGMLQ